MNRIKLGVSLFQDMWILFSSPIYAIAIQYLATPTDYEELVNIVAAEMQWSKTYVVQLEREKWED